MTGKKTAVIYARASDRKQVERDVSIPSQMLGTVLLTVDLPQWMHRRAA